MSKITHLFKQPLSLFLTGVLFILIGAFIKSSQTYNEASSMLIVVGLFLELLAIFRFLFIKKA